MDRVTIDSHRSFEANSRTPIYQNIETYLDKGENYAKFTDYETIGNIKDLKLGKNLYKK